VIGHLQIWGEGYSQFLLTLLLGKVRSEKVPIMGMVSNVPAEKRYQRLEWG
jgi:hypothetical protein